MRLDKKKTRLQLKRLNTIYRFSFGIYSIYPVPQHSLKTHTRLLLNMMHLSSCLYQIGNSISIRRTELSERLALSSSWGLNQSHHLKTLENYDSIWYQGLKVPLCRNAAVDADFSLLWPQCNCIEKTIFPFPFTLNGI